MGGTAQATVTECYGNLVKLPVRTPQEHPLLPLIGISLRMRDEERELTASLLGLLICGAAYAPRHYAEPGSDKAPLRAGRQRPGLA